MFVIHAKATDGTTYSVPFESRANVFRLQGGPAHPNADMIFDEDTNFPSFVVESTERGIVMRSAERGRDLVLPTGQRAAAGEPIQVHGPIEVNLGWTCSIAPVPFVPRYLSDDDLRVDMNDLARGDRVTPCMLDRAAIAGPDFILAAAENPLIHPRLLRRWSGCPWRENLRRLARNRGITRDLAAELSWLYPHDAAYNPSVSALAHGRDSMADFSPACRGAFSFLGTTMPGHLLIWGGPVGRYDLKAELPPDVTVLTVSGEGSSYFSNLALSYVDEQGHILPRLCAHAKLDVYSFSDVSLAGFSAWHGMANQILLRDTDMVTAAIAIDSCFSSPQSLVKKGYAAFGTRAALGEKLFVMSASSGGGPGSGATIGPGVPDYSFGYDCVLANAEAAASQAGVPLSQAQLPPGVPPTNRGRALQAGSLFALDYRDEYTHAGHVHKLTKPLIEGFLLPWLQGNRSSVGGGSVPGSSGSESNGGKRSSWAPWVFAAGATALGAALISTVIKKNQER